MSSETPAEPSDVVSASDAARPRRALLTDNDARPTDNESAENRSTPADVDARSTGSDVTDSAPTRSPSTPVRFPARSADASAADDLDETREFRLPSIDDGGLARRSAGPVEDQATDGPDRPRNAAARPGTRQGHGKRQGQGKNRPGAKKAAAKKAGAKKAGVKKAAAKQPPSQPQQVHVLKAMGRMDPSQRVPDQSHLPDEQRTDLAVRVRHLHVTYRTSFEKKPTLRQALMRFGRGERAVREVEALKDISFEVRTGTSLGIIGANGAGKSTLMRTVSGILPPTKGTVEVWGQASSLLALGVGFNNSLSGRENIILGGLAAGLSREEVEDRANEIAEWTELGDFIDMPMRTYSSGMAARVAFSVGVHMEPDILMIDEALSTGDARFKEKAAAKMAELRSKARAMFLVSHGLGSIKELCDHAIWIDKGVMQDEGDPEEVVDKYLDFMQAKKSHTTMEDF